MPASRDDVRLTWPTTPEVARPGRLSGLHRYTADGVEPVSTPAPDDNLLLRGDNLPGLRALAPLLAGSVQLIYIDPPYNTGSTDYVYADRRSRADWLSFMQARINAALPLLAPDGVFIAQCSFHQSAYLEVLLDQTPGLHKVAVLHALVRHPDRALTADKQFNDVVEQILIYSPDPALPHARPDEGARPQRLPLGRRHHRPRARGHPGRPRLHHLPPGRLAQGRHRRRPGHLPHPLHPWLAAREELLGPVLGRPSRSGSSWRHSRLSTSPASATTASVTVSSTPRNPATATAPTSRVFRSPRPTPGCPTPTSSTSTRPTIKSLPRAG
ncbi:DNA methyltransferase [Corynebacterium suedekumii]|nr:DNA methyltransferase [Corynebacterium suedekumii]